MKSIFLMIMMIVSCQANSVDKSRTAYIDKIHNVHYIEKDGKDITLTKSGKSEQLKIASDGTVLAWLEGDLRVQESGEKIFNDLIIFSHGRKQSITCYPLIRSFWFWKNGTRIAIDCGGRHFAGKETLYDVTTLKAIDSFDQDKVPTEERPSWSESSDHFEDE